MATKKKKQARKISLAYFIEDGYDGSVRLRLFKSEKKAEKVADKEDRRFESDVGTIDLFLNEDGELINDVDDDGEVEY